MTNVPYNRNIPFATNNPSEDQPRMQENTNSLEDLIEIDHIGFGETQGGYHKTIHQPVVPVGGQTSWDALVNSAGRLAVEAAKIAGVQQTFDLNYTTDAPTPATDTQLFSMTGKGGVSQLTGNVADKEGWCWCGGILIQWGTVTSTTIVTQTIFKGRNGTTNTIPFPNSCFVVLTQERNVIFNPNRVSIINKTDFTTVSQFASNFYFWVAIGN